MSKYVTKKHGLIIGSGNNFFYNDPISDKFRDFPAIVAIKKLYFDRYSTAHTGIRSIAEQFLLTLDYQPRYFPESWLNKNAPGWGYSTRTFFFQKRKHAIAFCKMVDDFIGSMRYL